MNLPNLLTCIRLFLAPFVVMAILAGRLTDALAWFGIAAFTDVADGAVARRWKLTTQTGAYLDPIVDKTLLSGVFLALAVAGIVPWWLVAIIFGRDLYILAGAVLLLSLGRERRFPPSVWGKISTFVQIVTAVSWMAKDLLGNGTAERWAAAMIWPCAAFTIWSGIHYTWRGIRAGVRIDGVSVRE